MLRRLAAGVLTSALLFTMLARPAVAQETTSVLVIGGTPAGVAAALAAARRGADVTLVTGRTQLGGILTDAMMDQWDLNVAPDGDTIQGGLFTEIHAALGDAFAPADAARVFGALVAHEPRIRLMTDARPVAIDEVRGADGVTVDGVRFARSDGTTFGVEAKTVVDATDNGDVAAMAGAHFDVGRQDTGLDERMQPVTLMFTVHGVAWTKILAEYDVAAFGPGGALDRRAWGYARLLRDYTPLSRSVLVRDLNLGREPDDAVTLNAIDVLGIDGRSQRELLRARAVAEREAPRLIAFLREHLPGFENATIGRFADAVYVRETRHFAGVERLTAGAVWDGAIPADAIGLSSYPLDLHPVTPTDKNAYAPRRHVYGIPFGTMVPRDLANVLIASPAISATHVAAGSARVIPTTIEEGEAAGVAAALAVRRNVAFTTMARDPAAIAQIRAALQRNGTILSYEDRFGEH